MECLRRSWGTRQKTYHHEEAKEINVHHMSFLAPGLALSISLAGFSFIVCVHITFTHLSSWSFFGYFLLCL